MALQSGAGQSGHVHLDPLMMKNLHTARNSPIDRLRYTQQHATGDQDSSANLNTRGLPDKKGVIDWREFRQRALADRNREGSFNTVDRGVDLSKPQFYSKWFKLSQNVKQERPIEETLLCVTLLDVRKVLKLYQRHSYHKEYKQ